jgi:hypothetical protein
MVKPSKERRHREEVMAWVTKPTMTSEVLMLMRLRTLALKVTVHLSLITCFKIIPVGRALYLITRRISQEWELKMMMKDSIWTMRGS